MRVLKPVNPLPENAKSSDSGDAGADGYSVLARASRYCGHRPDVGSEPDYPGGSFGLIFTKEH